MTNRERIIISAYTGYLMCDFNDVLIYFVHAVNLQYPHALADSQSSECFEHQFLCISYTSKPNLHLPIDLTIPAQSKEVISGNFMNLLLHLRKTQLMSPHRSSQLLLNIYK